ncbi:MAG: alpha-galactosidase [Lentimicrobiaceae bacterium]|nr:alpha-galactosidase [Lentimicrobiaceae bacterium]
MVSVFLITETNGQQQNVNTSLLLKESGLKINFEVYNEKYLRLRNMLPETYVFGEKSFPITNQTGYEVSMYCSGEENRTIHFGDPGMRLIFIGKEEKKLQNGKQIILIQRDPVKNLRVESFYEFNNASPVVRRYTKVVNEGKEDVGIEYLSSAVLYNYNEIPEELDNEIKVHFAYNNWSQEAQWKSYKPSELGWNYNGSVYRGTVSFSSIGSMSTHKYLPMGMIENTRNGLIWFWQIEHNGSWHWEMSEAADKSTYLYLGGPDEQNGHAWKLLKPGESYQTVPVALGCVKGGFNEAIAALTQYRRSVVVRPHQDNQKCPVIFNDYMNCLWAKPTTEKEMPLIETASKLKIDYFVIDAGWYAELNETWWDGVGLWQPSKTRFQGGLKKLLDDIKSKGMIPGLWLEIEVAGINSPLKSKPDNWFLMRHGKRVIDGGRYLLDFRNPEVIAHANEVIDRLIKDFGIGYFKIDYNSKELIGTETNASSAGQGMLEHNRAVIQWYKSVLDKYPDLIIEACASGGNRMDYAMLSQTQIVSSSDQQDYRKYPAILVGALAAVLPEQLGIWSYPLPNGNAKEASFNMVNGMLCRLYQSGLISKLPVESYKQVKKGIELYKSTLAPFIPRSVPFFPLGMPSMSDIYKPIAVGLQQNNKAFIAVWRLKGNQKISVPLPERADRVNLIYPDDLGIKVTKKGSSLQVVFPDEYMACIVEIEFKQD